MFLLIFLHVNQFNYEVVEDYELQDSMVRKNFQKKWCDDFYGGCE